MKSCAAAFAATVTVIPLAALAEGPSFDCAAASTRVERELCGAPWLGWFDQAMADLYSALRAGANATERARLRDEQRAWLGQRDRCETAPNTALQDCIAESYRARLAALGAATGYPGGTYDYVLDGFAGTLDIVAMPDGTAAGRLETINLARAHFCGLTFGGARRRDGAYVWRDDEDQYGDGTFCALAIQINGPTAEVIAKDCTAYCGVAGVFAGPYAAR